MNFQSSQALPFGSKSLLEFLDVAHMHSTHGCQEVIHRGMWIMSGWQDISTASKPLKAVLIDLLIEMPDGERYRVIDACQDDYYGWAVEGYSGCLMSAARISGHRVTHWMFPPDSPPGNDT